MRTVRGLVLFMMLASSGVTVAQAKSIAEIDGEFDLARASMLGPRYRSDKARASAAADVARFAMVRDAALAFGVQGGYRERSLEIAARIEARAAQLDRIFPFAPLVERGRLLMPAVRFTQDEQVLHAGTLRETGRVLRVVEPARIVTMPPTWRDWLLLPTPEVVPPDDVLLPTNGEERAVWRAAITEAWRIGRLQADAVVTTQIELLQAAYLDRLRYKELLAQKMIQPPRLGQTDLGIVRADDVLRIRDTLYQVSASARFEEPSQWRPVVVPVQSKQDSAP